MAIDDLPAPVVNLLNVVGVPWPYIDEDTVLRFAALTREFGQAVRTTHEDATQAVAGIAQWHQGASTEVMRSGWAAMSNRHVAELVTGCQLLAQALEVAAGYIVAQKAEAIVALAAMATAFVADQAAAVATAGIAEAAVPAIIEGAEAVVKSLVMDLEQYVIGQVVEAAAKPLFAKVEAAMVGLDWSRSPASPSGSGAGSGVMLDAESALAHTRALRQHAATMREHATSFQAALRGLRF